LPTSRDLVFARQDASADLSLPKFKIPPAVPSLINNLLPGVVSAGANTFASVAGQQAASQVFAPATTTVAARSAPTDGKFLFLDLVAREGLCQLP
jgi:hypothetical protein